MITQPTRFEDDGAMAVFVFRHDHQCDLEGNEIVDKTGVVGSGQGVFYPPARPVCVQLGLELGLVVEHR